VDEDAAWADEEPDDDTENWKLKIIMKDEYDM
jgi:COMPASS component SWD1